MPTPVRNFRIADPIWKPARKKANEIGLPLSFFVKTFLQNFAQQKDDDIIISEPVEIKMPRSTQILSERFAKAVRKATQRKK